MIKKIIYSTFATVIAIYLLLSVGVYLIQDSLVFPGAKLSLEQIAQLEKHYPDTKISFDVDGVILHGWHLNKQKNKTMLFYYGGNEDNLFADVLRFSSLSDFQTVLVNYRGFGLSEGTPTEKDIYRDVLFIYDQLTTVWQPEKIILIGRSLGTGVATYVASERKSNALVLVTPYDTAVSVGKDRYPLLPVDLLMKHRFDSISRADKLTMPSLVMKAEVDEDVPHQYTDKLVKRLPKSTKVVTIMDTDHVSIVDSADYFQVLSVFLKKQLN